MDMALAFEPCLFPRISTNRRDVQREEVDTHEFDIPSIATKESMLQYLKTAWAILLAKYTNSCTVRFGLLPDQSKCPDRDTFEEWTGSLKQKHCAQEAVLMRRCNKWLPSSSDYKGRFNTAIACVDAVQKKWFIANWAKEAGQPIDLMVLLESSHVGYRISLSSRPTLLDQNFLQLLAFTLTHILHHVIGTQQRSLESLDLTPDRHHDQIRNWSEFSPKEAVDECIHYLIQRRCAERPNLQAICAWDGTLTYKDLDHFSSTIGSILEDSSIGPGSVVPLFFEKSKWTAVAILGVLKTGAAFVLLEPSHPVDRLRHICQDVKATIILSSTTYAEASSNLSNTVVEISDEFFTNQTKYTTWGRKNVTRGSSKQAAYIAYTSGSTGLPKGIIIEHGSFCTNVVASSEAHNLTGSSRVLQFASYAFDVSIHETLVPLILGACVCVPSASQRVHELQDAINDLGANWMELTPSVARLLDPDDIPAVGTLILGGEAIMSPDVARWASRVKLIVAYGPAECTVVSTLQPLPFPDCDASNIGRAYGGTAHVVEADNHEKLVPIGVAGELVIGGPIVGREYLNRPELTAAAFITKKSLSRTDRCAQRFYKTGDLVRQTSDGTFIYIGRKDTQVKIRGQRIELGEIEHHAQDLFLGASVAAGVAKQYGQPILVLFVAWAPAKDAGLDEDKPNALFWKPDDAFILTAQEAKSKLTSLLPIYMVPNFVIPLRTMPLSHTGKVDRKALQSVVSSMSKSELQMCQPRALSEPHKSSVKTVSPVHKNIAQLFSRILPLAPDEIQDDDDFFQMGGDSILAVSLVGEARKLHRYDLTVTSIFQNPTVHQLCQHIENKPLLSSSNEQSSISPFSMLSPAEATVYRKLAVEQCDIFYDDIEDIYPCTPLQERLIVGSSHKPGAFQAQFSFVLPHNIDWSRLHSAWNIVSFIHPILRTRLIEAGQTNSSHNALQVVVRGEEIEWLETASDCHPPKSKWDGRMSFGTPLLYLVAMTTSRNAKLTLVMHHALFDWWSYNQILDAVQRVYVGQKIDPGPFVPFINHIQQLDKATAREFWQNEFNGLHAIAFPAHRPTGYTPQAVEWTKKDFRLDLAGNGGATTSTMIRLAWGILISQYTSSPDVVFGVTVMGRNTHTAASAAGPTIATYPFRMVLQQDLDINEALRRTQDHGISITAFEQTGIHQIQQASSEAAMACEFQSLLVVQPPSGGQAQKKLAAPLLELENNDSVQQQSYANFSTHILTIVCEPKADILTVNAFFDATVLPSGQVQLILQQMEHILDRIAHDPQAKLGGIIRDRPNLNGEIGPLQGRGSLAEVEQKACEYLGDGFQVAADLVVPRHMRTSKLVLFVGFYSATQQQATAILASPEEDTRTRLSQLLTYLQESFPANVAPSACIPVQLPNQPSTLCLPGRVQLRKSASMETWTSLTSLIDPKDVEVRRPLSPIESKLQRILASVLHLEPDSVSVHDDFSSLGCDSIVAIQFSSQCNRENIRITTRDIFDCKTVASLSLRAGERALTTAPKSDNFSLIRSTYNNLDVFKTKVKALAKLPSASQIIDAYPCTSSHLGLMTRHHSHTIWELTGSGSPIDVTRLVEAWRRVVSRHPVLRTVLSGDSSNLSPLHVVLDSYPVDVEVITGLKSDNTWSTIQRRWLPNSGRNELVYKFTIYKTTAGRIFCKLEGGYAFLDATSVLVILRELGAAYHDNLPSTPAPLYRSWVAYLQQWADNNCHMDYWRQYLSGTMPCIFPMPLRDGKSHGLQVPPRSLESVTVNLVQTSVLRDYCRVLGIGITSVLQLAWALVLQQYTGSADVCFGTLTSGRDAAFANINDLVGSLFNVLSCRFSLTGRIPLHEILKENQVASREKLSHQYCSLKDVTSEVYTEGGQLFNTCLSVEEPLSNKGELEFTAIETHEETEYDIIVTIVVDADITKVQLTYWSSGLDEAQATTIAGSLESSLQHIILSAENSQQGDA